MRKAILTGMLAVGAVTAASSISSPAQAQYAQCIKGRGCVPTSQQAMMPASISPWHEASRQHGANGKASTGSSISVSPARSRSMCLNVPDSDVPI